MPVATSPNLIAGSLVNLVACAYSPQQLVPLGNTPSPGYPVAGLDMTYGTKTSIYLVAQIPREMTFATGLTFTLLYCLRPNNADLSGTSVVMEVTAAPLVSGTGVFDDAAFAGVTGVAAQSAALPNLEGVAVIQEITIPVTQLGGLKPGDVVFVRIVRKGNDVNDTNRGHIVFVAAGVRNT